jgi:hypothetical protein
LKRLVKICVGLGKQCAVNWIALIFVVFLVVVIALLTRIVTTPAPTTTWLAFQQKFPAAIKDTGLSPLFSEPASIDEVPLPLGLSLREKLHHKPSPGLVMGFPELVQHCVLESDSSRARLHCLVRYTEGKVACIVIRYPTGAKPEALRLRDALRQAFTKVSFSVQQIKDT